MVPVTRLDALAVARALRRGPATLDALAARLGAPERTALQWAVDEAREHGWVSGTDGQECGPDGVCGDAPPTMLSLTPAGREALR